jgi:hypothetical protein
VLQRLRGDEQAVPAALDEELANQIREVGPKGKKVTVEPMEPARRNPMRVERPDYAEEDEKSKANKILSQVGPCLILSILPSLFLRIESRYGEKPLLMT